MTWSVVADMGPFDLPMCEFMTKSAAEIYIQQIRALTDREIALRNSEDVRYLQEQFVSDTILVSVSL